MSWIDLDGAVNVRDLGGLPAGNGRTRANKLIRSDNLQGLTPHDVRMLVNDHHVRAVADLRTEVEVDSEGAGPLTREPEVAIHHLSLFPEAGKNTDVMAAEEDDGPPVLPWQEDRAEERRGAVATYLGYLQDRPDSIIGTLRLIASTDGATLVHCAAGKDRTGVVVALALDAVGVDRSAIIADYVATGERVEAILARLRATPTYAEDVDRVTTEQHRPKPETMSRLLDAVDIEFGGTEAFLRKHGWTDQDDAALRRALLAE